MALFGTGALVDPSRAQAINMKAPVINKPGASGFFERVLDPSTNNNPLGRALGMFGQGLMAQQPGVGGDIGRSLMGMHQQNRQDETTLLQRALMQARATALDNKQPPMSTAARMAQEMGLSGGTPEYVDFIRRYAFKPTILQIPNAMGGTDFTEYDPSGASSMPSPGAVEDGYRYMGGDPSNPASWSRM